jgi:hypothetical protein
LAITGGLAQAGQWLARKLVVIWKFRSHPNGSGSPALRQAADRYASFCDSAEIEGIDLTDNVLLNETTNNETNDLHIISVFERTTLRSKFLCETEPNGKFTELLRHCFQ